MRKNIEIARLYLSDGAPEAVEYEGNCLLFNGACPETVSRIQKLMSIRDGEKASAVRDELERVCNESLTPTFRERREWSQTFSGKIYRAFRPKRRKAA